MRVLKIYINAKLKNQLMTKREDLSSLLLLPILKSQNDDTKTIKHSVKTMYIYMNHANYI